MAHPSLAPALDILERLIAFDTRSSESNLLAQLSQCLDFMGTLAERVAAGSLQAA